jgi:hypothetical protein
MDEKACLLVLVAAPEVEETVADWLLAHQEVLGFTEQMIRGYNREHGSFSITEQVTGWQKRVMFHVQTTERNVQALLNQLKEDLTGCELQYWVMPLLECGATY